MKTSVSVLSVLRIVLSNGWYANRLDGSLTSLIAKNQNGGMLVLLAAGSLRFAAVGPQHGNLAKPGIIAKKDIADAWVLAAATARARHAYYSFLLTFAANCNTFAPLAHLGCCSFIWLRPKGYSEE